MKNIIKTISLILFGLFLTIVILEITLRIGGFTILSIQEYKNLQSIKEKGVYRIMCLGESTTQNQYPAYLQEILNQRNTGIKFSVIDKGEVGITTTAMLSKLEINLNKYHPDMIVTMIGINDNSSYALHETSSRLEIILALRSLKVYNLTRLLWLHMVTKAKETRCPISVNNNQTAKKLQQDIQKGAFKETDKKQDFFQTKHIFKNTIEPDPNNDSAYYAGLGLFYENQGKFIESEQMFEKAIELNPGNNMAYCELGKCYKIQFKFSQAEAILKKAIELNPGNEMAYFELGRFYRDTFKFSQAEALFKKAIELNPKNNMAYEALGILYQEIGKPELAKEYYNKTGGLSSNYYNLETINNYLRFKEILDKRNTRLVCVQYPMRSIKPLKKIFTSQEGVIFVDNEQIFKEALKQNRHKEYFVDMFAGDFGHCTQKGNRLLAENIANVILKRVFHK